MRNTITRVKNNTSCTSNVRDTSSFNFCQFLVIVFNNICKLLLHVTNDFSLGQDFHHVLSEVTSGKIETKDGVGKSITFINWDGMRNTITRVKNNTSCTSGSIQGKDGLNGNIHSRGGKSFKHDLGHLFSVCFWVQWGFGQKNGVLFWGNSKLIVESMMPNLLHVIPRGDNSVLNGVRQFQNTTFALCFISNVGILLGHTNHRGSMLGSSYNRWEHSTRCIVTSKSTLDHTGTIVDDKGRSGFSIFVF